MATTARNRHVASQFDTTKGARMTDLRFAPSENPFVVEHANRRAEWRFGERDGRPSFTPTTREQEDERFKKFKSCDLRSEQ